MKDNRKFDDSFFDEDAYSFIRSISTPDDDTPEKNPHKKRYAVIFLILFSVVFVAVVRHTYLNNDDTQTENINNYTYIPQTSDTPQKIFTETEIDEKLQLLSQSDTRCKTIYENKEVYPNDMLQAVCRNPEIVDFAVGYLTSDGTSGGGLTEDDINEDVPLFIQWDSRWGYVPYGDNVIGLSGCGPTCLSMVAVSLTGDLKYSPEYISSYSAKHGYYEESSGTAWALFTEGCRDFGLKSGEVPLNYNSMVNALDDGKLIICSMNPGDFTAVGHFIVIKGIDENGDFFINDPNSVGRSSRVWSYEELEWQIRNIWFFNT